MSFFFSSRRVILAHLSMPKTILKTGTDWEVLFEMNEETFFKHLRFSHVQFYHLYDALKDSGLNQSGEPSEIPLKQKLSLFLWYMANQNCFRELSDKFNISQSTAHRCVVELLTAYTKMVPSFIHWFSICEKATSSTVFYRKYGIKNIIGATLEFRDHTPEEAIT